MAMSTLCIESVRDYNTGLEHEDDVSQEQATLENKAVSDITTEIKVTSGHLLEIYLKRIQVYISQANFQAALCDADIMCHIDPRSPLGYLCMGDIYRQQGQQQQAIVAFTGGINTALSNHPQYSSLIRAKEDATTQQEKRVDFITQLPFEILMQHIIPAIIHHQPSTNLNQWPYLHVSTGWRDRILCSQNLRYETDEPSGIKVAKENQLEKFKDYVSSVTLYRFRNGDQDAELFPWQSSKSLRRLSLHSKCSFDCLKHQVDSLHNAANFMYTKKQTSKLLAILMASGDRLTHLTLSMNDYHNTTSTFVQRIPLEQILEHTPYLQMLNITRVPVQEWNATKTYPSLINLSIHDPPHTMTQGVVLHILEHFPSLQAFSMFRCDQSQSLRVIQEYCPFLNDLRYAYTRGEYEDDYLDFDSYNIPCNTQGGLNKIQLVVNYPLYNILDVISLLQQNHSTLEEINISVIAEDRPSTYERNMNISFPKLKSLHLTGNYDGLAHMNNWILKHAPNLSSINLKSRFVRNREHEIADPISEYITKLTMTITNPLDIQFIHRFVTHHIKHEKHSCLKHLALTFMDHVKNESIPDIGDLQQLDTLSIDVWHNRVCNDAFSTILEKCASHDHQFSSLSWKCHQGISNDMWRHLKRMTHIKDLTLGYELVESDILHHVWHCKPKRSLTMECTDDVSDYILDMLRGHFQHITFNVEVFIG